MPFCEKAQTECPVVKNLADLRNGELAEDNGGHIKLNCGSIKEISTIVEEIIEAGSCLGPETSTQADLDSVFEVWGPLMSLEMEGSVFCGISTFTELLSIVDFEYGINLNVISPEI